jgi:hypothetical protein
MRFTLNAGLMKPRRELTLVAGKEKMGVGKGNPYPGAPASNRTGHS